MRRRKQVRIVSIPARPQRSRCSLCGREWLSREEYAWRRRNGLPVWRCQHRRPGAKRNRDLTQALSLVALLTACALVTVT